MSWIIGVEVILWMINFPEQLSLWMVAP